MKGIKGAECLDETKFLEQALGGEVRVVDRSRRPTNMTSKQRATSVDTGTGKARTSNP